MKGTKRLNREEKKRQTRERILESAQELFARSGYEGSSVEHISENAGYSRGAFYAHFKNKTELMRALIAEGFDSDLEGIRGFPNKAELEDIVGAFRTTSENFYTKESNLLWMLEFQLAVIRHPELKSAYAEKHRELRQALQKVFEGFSDQGNRPQNHSPQLLADLSLIVMSGLSMYRLIYGEEITADRFDEAARLLIRGGLGR